MEVVSFPVDTPPSTVGGPGEFLDIDVDQLFRRISLIAADRLAVGGPVAAT
jgi:hypothetical protein